MFHYKDAQAMFDPTPSGITSNVIPINRKQVCVEVNRITAEALVLGCCDEDLDALCRDLGVAVAKKRDEYYAALEAQTKALSERSRRAGRG